MAIVRKKLSELGPGRRNYSAPEPTEEQIQKWKEEDGMADFEFSENARFVRNVDVRALRERLGLTQEEFALRYRLPLHSVQEWEQRRKRSNYTWLRRWRSTADAAKGGVVNVSGPIAPLNWSTFRGG